MTMTKVIMMVMIEVAVVAINVVVVVVVAGGGDGGGGDDDGGDRTGLRLSSMTLRLVIVVQSTFLSGFGFGLSARLPIRFLRVLMVASRRVLPPNYFCRRKYSTTATSTKRCKLVCLFQWSPRDSMAALLAVGAERRMRVAAAYAALPALSHSLATPSHAPRGTLRMPRLSRRWRPRRGRGASTAVRISTGSPRGLPAIRITLKDWSPTFCTGFKVR